MSELTTGQRAVLGVMILGFVSTGIWGVLEYYATPVAARPSPGRAAPTAAAPVVKYPEITKDIVSRVDGDGDGRVSPAEYARVGMEDVPFSTFDLDGDGSLSAAEVEASFLKESPTTLLNSHAPAGSAMGGQAAGSAHPGRPGGPGQ